MAFEWDMVAIRTFYTPMIGFRALTMPMAITHMYIARPYYTSIIYVTFLVKITSEKGNNFLVL